MKNWIKSYWSNCLSIAAIICSVVAICVSLPSAPELGMDYIGVIIGILSLLVTMLIGWQIYNVITIDKKISDEVNKAKSSFIKEIEVIKDSSYIALQKLQFKTELINLNSYMSKGNFGQAIESLKSLLDSAIIINGTDFFRETAQVISNTKKELNNIYSFPDHRKELDDIFIKIVQSILAHLSGNDTETPNLTNILKEIEEHNEKISKYEVVKEGVDIANDD
ncbi:hypothetical protein [Bacteroides fragilis]|uniref:hypothetical protein n=1 Tax=Bacteroides fragilis TaxID=817 RepID=UPI0018C900FB|nr:hypothetical protein [Bacteroides fragilis]MBG9211830.1 hypothetical protein [Bacteroides fragilis]MBG9226373.1 hypothetical protein [Bacteroides fragilis]